VVRAIALEFSVPCLKMRGLVQQRPTVPNPVCNPADHLLRTDPGIAKHSSRLARVTEQRARTLSFRDEGRLDTEMLAKLEGQFAHGEHFTPCDIQNKRRRLTQREGPQ